MERPNLASLVHAIRTRKKILCMHVRTYLWGSREYHVVKLGAVLTRPLFTFMLIDRSGYHLFVLIDPSLVLPLRYQPKPPKGFILAEDIAHVSARES